MKSTNTKLHAIAVSSTEKLAAEALNLFVADAKRAIQARGRFCVAISRHTPRPFFELLATKSKAMALPWDKIHLFWVDEACIPRQRRNRDYPHVVEDFLSITRIPPQNVHRICSECRSCEYAASLYEQTISELLKSGKDGVPQFDLILLRMGADGHIASLFPDSYAFFDTKDLVRVMYFMDGRHTRITLTHPVLLAASHIAVMVSGKEKGAVLREVFTGRHTEVDYPICAIWPALDKVTWLIDRSAARFLPSDNLTDRTTNTDSSSNDQYGRF